jgi:putative hydrolase of the HAD superfamily
LANAGRDGYDEEPLNLVFFLPVDFMPALYTPIRFVYFDLGNVLVAFDRNIACRNVAKLFAGDPAWVDEILHTGGLQNDLESGRVSEAEFADRLRVRMATYAGKEALLSPSDADLLHAISDMFTPIDSMRSVLQNVRSQGIRIGILSNTCNAHWSWVQSQAYGVLEGPFDICVVSHEVRCMKPDRFIYETATEHAARISNALPEQILFLDDREENVLAAREHGWQAEVCLGGAAAEQVLINYNVLSVRNAEVPA